MSWGSRARSGRPGRAHRAWIDAMAALQRGIRAAVGALWLATPAVALGAWSASGAAAQQETHPTPNNNFLADLDGLDEVSHPQPPTSRTIATWSEAKAVMARRLPALARDQATVLRAETDVGRALSRMLPRLELGAAASYQPVQPTFEAAGPDDIRITHNVFDNRTLTPGVSVSLGVTLSLANLKSFESAVAGAAAARTGLLATRHALLGVLSSALLGVAAAERIAERNREGLGAAQKRMRLTERLMQLGRATALDTARFAQDLYDAQTTVAESNESLWQAREALGNALGLGEPVGVGETFDPATLLAAPGLADCTPVDRLEARADLRAAGERERRAELAVEAARLAYLPEIQVATTYSADYRTLSNAGIGNASAFLDRRDLFHTAFVTASVVWLAFDGGLRSANLDASLADLVAARAEQRELEIASRTELQRVQRLVTVAKAQLDIATRNLDAARKADQLSRRAFELGNATALEGVDAARRLRATEITHTLREVELIHAKVGAQMALAQCR